ncbi:4-hydroxy-tetrahydrodipicolinate reductase [Sphaerochaeta globosa]|uniref:4-hydroxy-tetrahydrodipicolinate reductase n=1 Tax=Sphaerochaeta globosa (strain ATCC BAA-1886 / DSM 22777 / Buddy) TaxID=158189 RepID=F0RVF1_SPHGB|nr:4-hydroxy-tetrahydrodipicolinate reductase [Sphaerochaeta globosa]ADY12943.1 Dihydrodipicolinate reductase [Sphaerochaeta globosa str. Buddy]
MVRVILYGCSGRMGQVITTMVERIDNLCIVAGIDVCPSEREYQVYPSLFTCPVEADVLLDFSSPKSLHDYLDVAIERRLAVVVATTGLETLELNLLAAASEKIPVFRSGSMSLGVNLVQQLIKNAAKVLGEQFDVEIIEKHHNLKKDAPSGTALMLADSVNEGRTNKLRYVYGRHGNDSLRKNDELGIHSLRGGTIVGEHEVSFAGKDEVITIAHQAFSRQVFATGAVLATSYIFEKKPGMYTMQDMITAKSAITTLLAQPEQILVSIENIPRDMTLVTDLYGALASNDVFIDMISHTGATNGHIAIAFTINRKDLEKTRNVIAKLTEMQAQTKATISENITKLTVEGPGMEFQSGVAYKVFSCMAKADISIFAVTTSENKIEYAIHSTDVDKAIRIIKEEFAI